MTVNTLLLYTLYVGTPALLNNPSMVESFFFFFIIQAEPYIGITPVVRETRLLCGLCYVENVGCVHACASA